MGVMRKSRLNKAKQIRLIEYFVAGTTARCAAALVGVNQKTAVYYFHRLREIIAHHLEEDADAVLSGEIEVDESYFGGRRKGKRGRGAAGKVPVFGLLKRGGKVYTKIIPDASSATLYPIIEKKVVPDSIVYSDSWRGYNVLDISDFKHLGSIIPNSLQTRRIISTALRISGTRRSVICASLMVFQRSILGYF